MTVVLLLLVRIDDVPVVVMPGLMPNGSEWHFSSASRDRSSVGMSSVESFRDSSLTSGVAGRTEDSRGRARARVGPFFFGLTASLCLAAEWLSLAAGESEPLSSVVSCIDRLYILEPADESRCSRLWPLALEPDRSSRSRSLEQLVMLRMLSEPSLLLMPPRSLRCGVMGLCGSPRSSSEASPPEARSFRRFRSTSASSFLRVMDRLLAVPADSENTLSWDCDKPSRLMSLSTSRPSLRLRW
uniref:(northern house mosquito) hypothetical protein n=1 Tax=Culex pipiens TaxID=7175 RepID=A0A8D8CRM1_CULPI